MPAKNKTLLGEGFRKIQPKLRVISNGSTEVNALRSEQCGAVSVTDDKVLSKIKTVVTDEASPVKAAKLSNSGKKGKLKALPAKILTNVFIQTIRPVSDDIKLPGETARRGNIITASVTFSELKKLAEDKNVSFIEIGANVSAPTPDISKSKVTEPSLTRWNFVVKKGEKDGKENCCEKKGRKEGRKKENEEDQERKAWDAPVSARISARRRQA